MSDLPSRQFMHKQEATFDAWGKTLWDLSTGPKVTIEEAGALGDIRHFLVLLDHEAGTFDEGRFKRVMWPAAGLDGVEE